MLSPNGGAAAAAAAATTASLQHHQHQQQQHLHQQQRGIGNAVEPLPLELSLNPVNGSLLTVPLSLVLLATTDALYQDLYNIAHGELDVTTAAQLEGSGSGGLDGPSSSGGGGGGDEDYPGSGGGGGGNHSKNHPIIYPHMLTTRRERMADLSFAQRRNELAWRLAQHGRAVQHVAALTAAHASTDFAQQVRVSSTALQHARTAWVQADEAQDAMYFFHAQLFPIRAAPHDIYGALDVHLTGKWYDLPSDLRLASDKYETVRESEYTRAEVNERWQISVHHKLLTGEVAWMKQQQQQQQQQQRQNRHRGRRRRRHRPPFNLVLRGGVLELRHGHPQRLGSASSSSTTEQVCYPIQALLTIVSSASAVSSSSPSHNNNEPEDQEESQDEWTLLSLDVRVQAKTGEFNHQLETTNRQRYDLHRLAALAMTREEARVRKLRRLRNTSSTSSNPKVDQNNNYNKNDNNNNKDDDDNSKDHGDNDDGDNSDKKLVARPLYTLFQVAQIFSLSWQLELLSAQALALRRGAWSAGEGSQINVTPVQFLDDPPQNNDSDDEDEDKGNHVLGVMSISFWRVDDVYGPPSMGDLMSNSDDDDDYYDNDDGGKSRHDQITTGTSSSSSSIVPNLGRFIDSSKGGGGQLVLSIRAEKTRGIRVALSGGATIRHYAQLNNNAAKGTIQHLIQALSNPLALSVSDALLAATRLCTDRKCHAVVAALLQQEQPQEPPQSHPPTTTTAATSSSSSKERFLPPWISLNAARGDISVSTMVSFHGVHRNHNNNKMAVLFRLACDARTGSFVPTFPRSMKLLRYLAGNDVRATENLALRMASTPENRRRAVGAKSTGMLVKEAFDGLVRSMNVLGQRVGVGGSWDDKDAQQSASIRERSIALACREVTISLTKCCGLAALFGLTPLAIGIGLGMTAAPDMAGGEVLEKLVSEDGGITILFPTPPLSILLEQQVMDKTTTTTTTTTKESSSSTLSSAATTAGDGDGRGGGGNNNNTNSPIGFKRSHLQQRLLAFSFAYNEQALSLYPLLISVQLDTPSSIPIRISSHLISFAAMDADVVVDDKDDDDESVVVAVEEPDPSLGANKRPKLCNEEEEENVATHADNVEKEPPQHYHQQRDNDDSMLWQVVDHLAGILSATVLDQSS